LRPRHTGEQAIELFLDDLIAFAGLFFQSGPVKHRDVATVVTNQAGVLTSPGDLRDSLSTHPKRAGNRFLRDSQFIRG
jgi:hypothetical protein